ncbi:MAG: hypothetical protein AN484_26560, partial [Aphanizomenon flos-aquae WA102]
MADMWIEDLIRQANPSPAEQEEFLLQLLPVMARLYEDVQNPREEAVKPPRFNGTYTDYPIFKREWAGYQQQMLPHWSERDVAKRLVAEGLCKSAKTGVERFQHL